MTDYERWLETSDAKTGSWKIKYYKGLGTSNDQEAKEYFKQMNKVTYIYDENADEVIDLAFNKNAQMIENFGFRNMIKIAFSIILKRMLIINHLLIKI